MINLNAIVQSAQGGQAVDNLARRFGLTPQQAQSAIDAILPAITMGLRNAGTSGAAGSILSHLGNPAHQESYADPSAADTGAAAVQGGSILGSLFGGQHNTTAVAQQAATESGVSASIIQAMLPAIVSMVLGGLMHSAQNGSFGGALSSILGSVLGRGGAGPATVPPADNDGGGLGGMIGSVLGGLFGGGGAATPHAPSPPDEAPEASVEPRAQGGTAASTLDEISNMIESGSTSSAEHQDRLAQILGR